MTSLDLPHRGGRELTGRQHRGGTWPWTPRSGSTRWCW